MKREIRILAIDDCAFSFNDKNVKVIGVLYRGGSFLDGFFSFHVKKDGKDATEKLIGIISKPEYKEQLKMIMIKGITLAGFNLLDMKKIYKQTRIPVVAVMRSKPNMPKFLKALEKINKDGSKIVENAGKITKINNLYVQSAGLTNDEIREILKITVLHANIPEPLRVSSLIAKGMN